MNGQSSAVSDTATRPAMLQALRIVAPIVTLLVLIQAFFAGRGLFLDNDLLELHGQIGHLTWLLVIVQLVLVFLAGIRGPVRMPLIGVSALLLILVTVQTGLGFSGRDGGQAAAWHVPNGVLIFGMTIATMSLLARLRREA
jgi:hypothetical protein